MKKIVLLVIAVSFCLLANAANNPLIWIYFYDHASDNMRLVLTTTCTDGSCPKYMGIGQQALAFTGTISFHDAAIENLQGQVRNIFKAMPKNCLTISAPQSITFNVDNAGNTTITCTSNY